MSRPTEFLSPEQVIQTFEEMWLYDTNFFREDLVTMIQRRPEVYSCLKPFLARLPSRLSKDLGRGLKGSVLPAVWKF